MNPEEVLAAQEVDMWTPGAPPIAPAQGPEPAPPPVRGGPPKADERAARIGGYPPRRPAPRGWLRDERLRGWRIDGDFWPDELLRRMRLVPGTVNNEINPFYDPRSSW